MLNCISVENMRVSDEMTITIGFVEHGLVAEIAGRYMKRLVCADIGIVLAKEENKICGKNQHHPNVVPHPSWLDMTVIKVSEGRS